MRPHSLEQYEEEKDLLNERIKELNLRLEDAGGPNGGK